MHLIRYLGAADLRILSAFNSYVHLVNLCKATAATAATTATSAAVAASEGCRNNPSMLRVGAGGVGAGFDGGSIRGGSLGSGGSGCSGGGIAAVPSSSSSRWREGEEGDGVLSETQVPFSLVNLVVHADQRRAPLRTFHFVDALPSPPPPPPTLSTSRSRRSGIGGCEDKAAGKGKEERPREMAEGGREELPKEEKEEEEKKKEKRASTARRCGTCETLDVIRIDDGDGSNSSGGGGAAGVTDGHGEDGNDEANKQVLWYRPCGCLV